MTVRDFTLDRTIERTKMVYMVHQELHDLSDR